MNGSTSSWSDEEITKITKLSAEGFSANMIANELSHRSRNAVIGKLHRMGLRLSQKNRNGEATIPGTRRAKRRGQSHQLMRMQRKLQDRQKAAETPEFEVEAFEAEPDPVAPMHVDLTNNHGCKWPYGDGPFTFCGHEKFENYSYCLEHAARSIIVSNDARREYVQMKGNRLLSFLRRANSMAISTTTISGREREQTHMPRPITLASGE